MSQESSPKQEELLPFFKLEKEEEDEEILCKFTPTIYIHGTIDEDMARKFREAVYNLKYERKSELCVIDIDTPGGSVTALFKILGIMKQSEVKFLTYCSGQASSCGAVLLSAGEPGMRFISPHGYVMIHPVSNFLGFAPFEDHLVEQKFIANINDRLLQTLAKNCKMSLKSLNKKIKDSGSRNLWLSSDDAVDFGIAEIIGHPIVDKINNFEIRNAI